MAENPDAAGGGKKQAGQQFHYGGLAGPVQAQQAGNFPGRDLEGKVLNGGIVAGAQQAGTPVGLFHTGERYGARAHRIIFFSSRFWRRISSAMRSMGISPIRKKSVWNLRRSKYLASVRS